MRDLVASRFVCTLMACVVLVTLTTPVHAKKLYRYQDENGKIHVSQSIPPNMVRFGYEVLDGSSMRVIEVQPPALSNEEYAVEMRREQLLAECKTRMKRVRVLYTADADVDHALAQAHGSIDNRIANANAAIIQLQGQLRGLQTRAANLERSGVEPPAELLNNIQRAQEEIASLQREIGQREEEKLIASARFEEDRAYLRARNCEDVVETQMQLQENTAVSSAPH